MKVIAKNAFKIKTREDDIFEDGDDLYIIGEIKHPDILDKVFIAISSPQDLGPIFIMEKYIHFTDYTEEIEITSELSLKLTEILKKYPKCLF